MQKQILRDTVLREDKGYIQEPYREINNLTKNHIGKDGYLDNKDYLILFTNLTNANEMPEVLKFVAFNWTNLKLISYREPEVKIITFEDYNEALNLIKKSTQKLLSEGLTIWRDEEYKRLFLFKDIGKHKIKEIKKGDKVIKLGDFLSTCWGYDQTNVEMFTVKKIIGKNYLIIQEVAQEVNDSHLTYDNVKVSGSIIKIDIPIKAYISNDGYMSVCEYGYKRSLHLTDMNKTHYKTNTQFGH